MYEAEFSQRTVEPIAGSVFGYRVFTITEAGYLAGVYRSCYHWSPGVNRALCIRETDFALALDARVYDGWIDDGGAWLTSMSKPVDLRHPDPESWRACHCGFWAYTSGRNMLNVVGPAVTGVIEGWGRLVVGPNGFRASNARIVGLCFPPVASYRQSPVVVDDVTSKVTENIAQTFAGINLAVARFADRLAGRKPRASLATLDGAKTTKRPWENVPAGLRRKVMENYPDVPLFGTPAALQAEIPLSDLSSMLAPASESERES